MASTMNDAKNKVLSQLPQVDKLMQEDNVQQLSRIYPRELIVAHIRKHLENIRKDISKMPPEETAKLKFSREIIYTTIFEKLEQSLKPNLRRVINAAGIILNTGLGRALLSKDAQKALIEVSSGFSSVEIDLSTGLRGVRHDIIEDLLIQLTGAEAAAVVNNNAAATYLTLNTLSNQKEAIVSRGELITIGGSFRIPDIMAKSGAIMKEIGTTNHTKAHEYDAAINENTGLLLKVHTSNYKVIGFVSETSLEELVKIGKKNDLPVFHDLGSGMLFDLNQFGLPKEPVVQESIKQGADVVSFSGDKLLGGPQAGIIVGRKKYIDQIKKNQMARALRCGKLTFAALEATLRLYFDKEKLIKSHPSLNLMLRSEKELQRNALKLKSGLEKIITNKGNVTIEKGLSEIGGGSLATESLETRLVTLELNNLSVEKLSTKLRQNDPPIITRITKDRVIFDMRTLLDNEMKLILKAITKITSEVQS